MIMVIFIIDIFIPLSSKASWLSEFIGWIWLIMAGLLLMCGVVIGSEGYYNELIREDKRRA